MLGSQAIRNWYRLRSLANSVSTLTEKSSITITGQFVEFEAEGDREEEQLVADGNEEGDSKVIVVKRMNYGHSGGWRYDRLVGNVLTYIASTQRCCKYYIYMLRRTCTVF